MNALAKVSAVGQLSFFLSLFVHPACISLPPWSTTPALSLFHTFLEDLPFTINHTTFLLTCYSFDTLTSMYMTRGIACCENFQIIFIRYGERARARATGVWTRDYERQPKYIKRTAVPFDILYTHYG